MSLIRRPLTRTERLLLLFLGALILGLGSDAALRQLYFEPRQRLLQDIEAGEERLWRMRQLEARAAEIRRDYEALQVGRDEGAGGLESQSSILLEIEGYAREKVRLYSLQPRADVVGGRPTLHLRIEAGSDLAALGEFLETAIRELGTTVTALTLTPERANDGRGAIRSRIEMDVVYNGS